MSAFSNLPKEVFTTNGYEDFPPRPLVACPSIPIPPPTDDVNNLKPGHIKVVMSMGDSIIAGSSAKDTSVISLKEYRGLSFCSGGDAGVTTFPNILKQFTTGLQGASTGIGLRTIPTNGLNGAVSGAINKDMLGQAQWLVERMRNMSIDVENDWKVLTIWIGSNNLCAVCNNGEANNAANFEQTLTSALNYLISLVPKLFVNLVSNLDVSSLYYIKAGTCELLHTYECPCVGTNDANKRALVSATAKQYMEVATKIANEFNSRNLKTQAVVVQPFLTNNVITDRSLLSAADCFHPSASAHALAATALWNNMLTPKAEKKTSWNEKDVPICPTADSIFPLN